MKTSLAATLLCCTCAVMAGCSDQPAVAPVRGVVTMDGKPLSGGRVMFQPIASGDDKVVGRPAIGSIQPDGSFKLTTYKDGDGALVGSHHPVVMENRKDDDATTDRTTDGPKIGVITLRDLTFTVVSGEENNFKIELNSRSHNVRDAIPEKGL